MNYTIHIFSLLLTLIFNTVQSQPQEIKSIDSLINLCIENNFINGDILIEVNNKPLYKKTIGFRDNATKEILEPNAIFNIGSVSKPFTAIAIMQLQEKNLLNVDDKVIKYLPLFPYDNVCIKHLLSHTSGIIANLDMNDKQRFINNDSLIGFLINTKPKLQFEPGSKWSYSNIGYDILAIIVEQVSNMRFDEYMNENIFLPSRMSRTFIPRTNDVKKWLSDKLTEKDLALPHSFENIASCFVSELSSQTDYKEYFYFYGSSNVYSTVYDLAKFDEALSKNKILSKGMQEFMYKPYKLNSGDFVIDSLAPILSYYSLGWEISVDTTYGKIIWHKGRSGGTRTVFLRNPSKKQLVVFADNNDNPSTDLKAIACLKILNHESYRNPIYMSLVQKFGCDINSMGYDEAYTNFIKRKETQRQNFYISKDEMVDLAILLESNNNLKDALSVLKFGNELFPEYWWLLITYGDFLFKNNQPEQAISIYTNAVRTFPGSEEDKIMLLGSVGSQFIDANRLIEAETVLKLNTELFPTDCNSYDNYAFILDKNNKLDLAIVMQEKAVALASEQNHSLLNTLKDNLEKLKSKKK
jgi:CubicO group peptidase (beta-lactamase class C family)